MRNILLQFEQPIFYRGDVEPLGDWGVIACCWGCGTNWGLINCCDCG